MENRVGQHIGNYRLVRLLGQGGFADVYLGEHLHLTTLAAIKILQMRLADSNREQFRSEARAIASLVHPHIVRVLDFGEENGVPFLVMDYTSGGTLRARHPRNTRLPLDVVVSQVKQIAEALQYAHDQRLIHRDIKPENMLLGPNNTILLSDFGLVLVAQHSESRSTKEIAGTVAYMAPEQIQGKPRPASDQYALGILVYEWLSGTPPFQGAPLELYGQHLYASPPPLQERVPSLPFAVEEVVMTALAKDPQQRFAGVLAFATALEQASQEGIQTLASALPLASHWPHHGSPSSRGTPPSDQAAAVPYTRTPPEPFSQSTEMNAPSDESAAATYIKIPPEPFSQPTLMRTPSDQSAVTFIKTPPEQFSQRGPFSQPTLTHPPSSQPGLFSQTDQPTYVAVSPSQPSPPLSQASSQRQSLEPAPPMSGVEYPRPKRRRWWLIAALLLLVALLIVGGVGSLVPGGWTSLFPNRSGGGGSAPSSATVTITPVSQDVKHSYTISAVTGIPSPSRDQVGARLLSSTTPSQSQTANATGSKQKAAVQASGTLIVTCRASSTPLTIPAGTVFTGSDGVQVATDMTITTNGCASMVSAHAVQPGTGGNIPANDMNQPYQGYSINNTAAFAGGQNALTSTVVQQSDIDGAAHALIPALTQTAQQSLLGEVRANERLSAAPSCQPHVTSDHAVGDAATTVTVSVTVTCTGEAYDRDGALSLAAQMLQKQTRTDLGAAYALAGKIVTTVLQAESADTSLDTIAVSVEAEGVWVYQFSRATEQTLAHLIAGKKRQEALALLAQEQGVAQADVQVEGGDGSTFPSDSSHIRFTVVNVAGK